MSFVELSSMPRPMDAFLVLKENPYWTSKLNKQYFSNQIQVLISVKIYIFKKANKFNPTHRKSFFRLLETLPYITFCVIMIFFKIKTTNIFSYWTVPIYLNTNALFKLTLSKQYWTHGWIISGKLIQRDMTIVCTEQVLTAMSRYYYSSTGMESYICVSDTNCAWTAHGS